MEYTIHVDYEAICRKGCKHCLINYSDEGCPFKKKYKQCHQELHDGDKIIIEVSGLAYMQ